MKQALIIMAKRPEAGRTKTRLCPPLTLPQAADLYAAFLADVIVVARSVKALQPSVRPFFAYSPLDSEAYFRELAPDFGLVPQQGESLGQRLDFVLSTCLHQGYDQAAAINSDSPNLPATYLAQAFTELIEPSTAHKSSAPATNIVFGPSEDGGYYLIGATQQWLHSDQPRIVREITMSTPTVLEDSLTVAEEVAAKVKMLPSWYDIDTVDELQRLYQDCRAVNSNVGQNTVAYIEESLGQEMWQQKPDSSK